MEGSPQIIHLDRYKPSILWYIYGNLHIASLRVYIPSSPCLRHIVQELQLKVHLFSHGFHGPDDFRPFEPQEISTDGKS